MSDALSFEKVWELFQETAQQMKELDGQMGGLNNRFGKLAEYLAAWKEEIDWQKEEDDRLNAKWADYRFGNLWEYMVAPSIKRKFEALNFRFNRYGSNVKIYGPDNRVIAEINLFLEGVDVVIAVEVSETLRKQDIDWHLEQMETLRRRADKHNDKRKIHGAAAGAIMTDEIKQYALAAGLFVLEQVEDTFKIDIPEGFTPRAW